MQRPPDFIPEEQETRSLDAYALAQAPVPSKIQGYDFDTTLVRAIVPMLPTGTDRESRFSDRHASAGFSVQSATPDLLKAPGGFCQRRRMVDRKRPTIVVWIVPLLVGFAGFYRVMQSPSFAMYRTVDVVQLLGSGVCFGAAMVGIIFMLRASPS